MEKRTLSVIWLFSLLFVTVIVHGQGFNGPGVNNNRQGQPVMVNVPILVSAARNLPKDSWVVLSGNITNTLPGGKYYTFRDSSGEITIEIEPKVWRGLSVEPSDRVVIGGEIEVNKGQVLIEVKTISGSGRMNTRQGQALTITQPITVNEARNLPNDSWVIAAGNIINFVGKEYYTFRDSSGEISVEIKREVWRGLSVGVSDMVEIHGDLKIKKGQFSIEVKAIRKL